MVILSLGIEDRRQKRSTVFVFILQVHFRHLGQGASLEVLTQTRAVKGGAWKVALSLPLPGVALDLQAAGAVALRGTSSTGAMSFSIIRSFQLVSRDRVVLWCC
ncbi:hypothetical protein AOLI_G00100350 [Acnodon oligacanthus]